MGAVGSKCYAHACRLFVVRAVIKEILNIFRQKQRRVYKNGKIC